MTVLDQIRDWLKRAAIFLFFIFLFGFAFHLIIVFPMKFVAAQKINVKYRWSILRLLVPSMGMDLFNFIFVYGLFGTLFFTMLFQICTPYKHDWGILFFFMAILVIPTVAYIVRDIQMASMEVHDVKIKSVEEVRKEREIDDENERLRLIEQAKKDYSDPEDKDFLDLAMLAINNRK